jgi:histone H2A
MEEKIKTTYRKKKHSRFFEIYITKILQQVSPENGIDTNAKQQLNTSICILCRKISEQALALTEYSNKKTISVKEIKNSLLTLISGELLTHSINEGHRAVTKYEEYNQTKITLATKLPSCSRNNKAEIIFPPSILEKFLRRFGYSKIMITSNSPVYLAAVVEYITAEILNIASIKAQEFRKNRITVRHMELGIRSDPEFNSLFNKLNIKFLGGGFLPGIHKEFLIKKKPKTETKNKKIKPGTIAIKEIKKYQKNGNLILARTPFERLVRLLFDKNSVTGENYKISKDVFTVIQYYIEQNIIQSLRMANLISIHSGHTKLTDKDILLSNFISQKQYNFSIENYENFINQIRPLITVNNVSDEEKVELESVSLATEDSSEEEVPTEDSSEEEEYLTETDFFTETDTPWAGPRYLKSRTRVPKN